MQEIKLQKIKKITKREEREPVYNMEVEKHHNFSVNGGLIVHNSIDSIRYAMESESKDKYNKQSSPSDWVGIGL